MNTDGTPRFTHQTRLAEINSALAALDERATPMAGYEEEHAYFAEKARAELLTEREAIVSDPGAWDARQLAYEQRCEQESAAFLSMFEEVSS